MAIKRNTWSFDRYQEVFKKNLQCVINQGKHNQINFVLFLKKNLNNLKGMKGMKLSTEMTDAIYKMEQMKNEGITFKPRNKSSAKKALKKIDNILSKKE